jgi:hypothetical protein
MILAYTIAALLLVLPVCVLIALAIYIRAGIVAVIEVTRSMRT